MPQPFGDRGFPWGACKESLLEGRQWDQSPSQVTATQEQCVKGSAWPGWAAGQGDPRRPRVCPKCSCSQEGAQHLLGWRRGRLRGGGRGHKCSAPPPKGPLAVCMHPPPQSWKLRFLILRGWMVPLLQETSPTFLQQLHRFTYPPATHTASHTPTSPPTFIILHF